MIKKIVIFIENEKDATSIILDGAKIKDFIELCALSHETLSNDANILSAEIWNELKNQSK